MSVCQKDSKYVFPREIRGMVDGGELILRFDPHRLKVPYVLTFRGERLGVRCCEAPVGLLGHIETDEGNLLVWPAFPNPVGRSVWLNDENCFRFGNLMVRVFPQSTNGIEDQGLVRISFTKIRPSESIEGVFFRNQRVEYPRIFWL